MNPKQILEAELVLDARCQLGEGPLWSVREQALYWLDIERNRVHRFDPRTAATTRIELPHMPGAVVERARGGLAVADQQGFAGLDFATGKLERWAQPESDRPGNRFNDGKVDPRGRFWAGTLQLKEDATGAGKGALYRLDVDRRATLMVPGITCANGLAWTADERTFYYIDTPTMRIDAFDFDAATGAIANRRQAVGMEKSDGWPDGMCIDAEGMLWCGHWGGWAVNRWDPRTGRKLATVRVPVERVTSCCFGGAKLDELWITTASRDIKPEERAKQPNAGGIFRVRPGVSGPASVAYAG